MHLGLSDAEIAERITSDPTFRAPNGQFDRTRFEQMIRDAGFTEPRFVAEQRNVLLRRQIAQTVGGDVAVPTVAMDAINRFQNEQRDIDYRRARHRAGRRHPGADADEQLTKYFDERKALFRAPEYRKVTLLALSPAELAKPDAGLRRRRQGLFRPASRTNTARRRSANCTRWCFRTRRKAAAARDEIAKGKSFDRGRDRARAEGRPTSMSAS